MDVIQRMHQFTTPLYCRALYKKMAASLLVVMFTGLTLTSTALAQTGDQRGGEGESTGTPSGAALQAASWLATVPYGATKVGFALVGGVVGSLTYVFSGGNNEAAKSVWTTTIYGTYVLTPEHLKGQKPIRFLGLPDRTSSEMAQMKEN